ncbi:MAG: SGNH/GDSL hydrolase family protein [Pseudomonadota bacterium]
MHPDTKPYVRYHAELGYEYVPDVCETLPRPGGGRYTIRVNRQGIRANREFSSSVPAGKRRFVVLGDSFAAGQYLSNEHRFSEVLERFRPDIEVVNLALEGTGTDQQLMLFERFARDYAFDVVVAMPFLQNIRRNLVTVREAWDARTGAPVLRGKPRYEFIDGNLSLSNVPVPETVEPPIGRAQTDTVGTAQRLKSTLNKLPGIGLAKQLAYRLVAWEPFPEYRDDAHPAWQLMRALLLEIHSVASQRPMAVVPLFYDSYVRYRMADHYWRRFRSLENDAGIAAIDVLPYFRASKGDTDRLFLRGDAHLSHHGHLLLAHALERELTSRGFLATS